MLTIVVRRLASAAVAFFGITFVLFQIANSLNRQPIFGYEWQITGGFRQSPVQQYVTWLIDFVTAGGLSQSAVTGRPASVMIFERVPATLLLLGSALALQAAVGISLGVIAARNAHGRLDKVISLLAAATISAPPFLTGLAAIYVFSVVLHWFPSGGLFTPSLGHVDPIDWLRHLVLPTIVLATLGLGRLVRQVRGGLLDALGSDYAVLARAKGAGANRVAFRHALPNTLLPVVTVIGLQLSVLLGGSFLVEIVFAWPGTGILAYSALTEVPADVPVLLAYGATAAAAVMIGSLLADLAYLRLDPRISPAQTTRAIGQAEFPTRAVRAAAIVALAIVLGASDLPASVQNRLYLAAHFTPPPPPCAGGCTARALAPPVPTPAPTPRAAPPTPSPAPSASSSPTPRPTPRLADPAARVSAVLTSVGHSINTPGSPGCAVAISDHGRAVFARGYGSANLATGAPITPTTVFDVASVSKQFTAAAVLLLVQQGRMSLADDIHRYVPELPAYDVPITLAELMYHRSGLPFLGNYLATQGFVTDAEVEAMSPADLLAVIRAVTDLAYPPGSMYRYGDTEYVLLRIAVERVSGMSFEQFAQVRFFGPLGMTQSFIDPRPDLPVPGKATPYGLDQAGAWVLDDLPTLGWDVGAADLQTTVLDLLKWAGNFETGQVGGPALLAAQLVAGSEDDNPDHDGQYAAGLHRWTIDGLHIVYHDGGTEGSGFRADLAMDPADHVAVALTCNVNTFAPHLLGIAVLEAWLGVRSSINPAVMAR